MSSTPSASASPSGDLMSCPDLADWTVVFPRRSKREYLLAQIRQKNAIIESLLKQVRIPAPGRPPPLPAPRSQR